MHIVHAVGARFSIACHASISVAFALTLTAWSTELIIVLTASVAVSLTRHLLVFVNSARCNIRLIGRFSGVTLLFFSHSQVFLLHLLGFA